MFISLEITQASGVTLHYTLSLSTGKIAATTRGDEPLKFVVGDSDLLPAFENCLLGLKVGDRRRFDIACMDAYGPIQADLVQRLARDEFPPEIKLESGVVIGFELPSGEEVPGTVIEVAERDVMIDFSHPLAGHDLVFDVEILDVTSPSTTV